MSGTPQVCSRVRVYKATMAFQSALTSLVSQQLQQLLQQVCQDYSLDAAEVIPRYLEAPTAPVAPKKTSAPKAPRAPKTERPMCSHMVKGQPCKHRAREGDDLCHIHIKQRDNPKPAKEPKRVCTGTTSKGAPCSVKAQDGCDLCHLHMAKANAPQKVGPTRKPAKAKAPQVEGRGESPPPVFCQPCAPVPAPAAADDEEEMEDIQRRLAAIMVGAGPSYTPTPEALEAQGFSDDPEEFDEEQMESPHSQQALQEMKEFDGFMEE